MSPRLVPIRMGPPPRLVVMCAVAFCAGAGGPIDLGGPVGAAGLCLLAALMAVLCAGRHPRSSRALLGLVFFGAGCFVAARAAAAGPVTEVPVSLPDDRLVLLEGWVEAAPAIRVGGMTLELALIGLSPAGPDQMVPLRGRARVFVRTLDAAPAAVCAEVGDRVRVFGRARLVRPPLSELEARRGRGRVRASPILTAFVSSPQHCLRLIPGERAGLRVSVERLRASIQRAISDRLDSSDSAIVRAFAIGDRSGIPEDVQRAFVRSGLAHLLAVSGLHLAIVSGLFLFAASALFRRLGVSLGRLGARRAAAICGLPVVCFYALLVGASPSAVRAALMVSVWMVGAVLRRGFEPWTAMALALLAMVASDPSAIFDVSLQLSFTAVAALLRLYPWLRRCCASALPPIASRGPLRAVSDLVLVSAAATLGTAPVVAYHFQQVSLAGLLANIPATPLASFVLVPMSLAGGLLAATGFEGADWFLGIAAWAGEALVSIARGFGGLSFAALGLPSPSRWECVLYYSALWLLSGAPSKARRRLLLIAVLGLAAVSLDLELASRSEGRLRIHFLPVGQGDAALVELPGGEVMLVDTGPPGQNGWAAERLLIPALRARRIRRLDILVLTHPHADHVGGLAAVLEAFEVGEVWWTGDPRDLGGSVGARLADRRVRIVMPGEPPVSLPGVELSVLGPLRAAETYADVNDGSVVLRLSYGRRSILLTGDAEAVAEGELVARFGDALRADVLKAGHHGSRSSSSRDFVDRVQPSHVVLSLGADNRFGFPHPEAERRLRASGARIWRTDVEGEITVETDGVSLEVSGYWSPASSAENKRSTSSGVL